MHEGMPDFFAKDKENEQQGGKQANPYLSASTEVSMNTDSAEVSEFLAEGHDLITSGLQQLSGEKMEVFQGMINLKGLDLTSFEYYSGDLDDEDAQEAKDISALIQSFTVSEDKEDQKQIVNDIAGILG